MKKLVAFTLVLLLILSVCACNNQVSDNNDGQSQNNETTQPTDTQPQTDNQPPQEFVFAKPETNLEFWIAENVDDFDFSKYQEKYGMFGGRQYYGTGYVPTTDGEGQQVDPEHCVLYTVTSYPDYSDKEKHVTYIYITDPTVAFCGISLNSSFEEFETIIKQQGFKITESSENWRQAENGKYWISFTKEAIRIMVKVENKDGIVF